MTPDGESEVLRAGQGRVVGMGGEEKSRRRRERSRSPLPSPSASRDEEGSRKRRKRDGRDRKSRKDENDSEGRKKEKKRDQIHKHSRSRDGKEKKPKEKHKRRRKDMGSFEELSKDDYFAKNNEFSTWLKEERGMYFSDLSADAARELFSNFVKQWNSHKLQPHYYEGIASAPRTAHNWKIKRDELVQLTEAESLEY